MEQIDRHLVFFIHLVHTINPLVFSLIIAEFLSFFKLLLYKIMKYHFGFSCNFVVY